MAESIVIKNNPDESLKIKTKPPNGGWLYKRQTLERMNKMEKVELKYKGHDILVHNAYGYDEDVCYWDKIFFLTIDDESYILFEVGSLSGYTKKYQSLKKIEFDYLDERKMTGIDDFYTSPIEHDCFCESDFLELFDFMLLHQASEVSYDDGEYLLVA